VSSGPALDEKVLLIDAALRDAAVPHAFGGALALAYYAEPRATRDIDVNVFVRAAHGGQVLGLLGGLGVSAERRSALREIGRDGQTRLRWGPNPVDLFFSYDPFHDACAAAVRTVPFGDADIPILAAEHLIVCKVVFDRRKDWIDVEQVLFLQAGMLDVAEVRRWLHAIVGVGDPRARRFDDVVQTLLG
jgi:hypothetical protein